VLRPVIVYCLLIVWFGTVDPSIATTIYDDESVERRVGARLAALDSLLHLEEYERAARTARRLLARHGDCPLHTWQIQQRLGLILLKGGHADLAVAHLEAAIRAEPGVAESHLNLAAALIEQGKRGRAFSEFEEAAMLAPDDYRVHLDFGQAMLELQMVEAALGELARARELCADCFEVDLALANAHLAADDFAAAVAPLRRLHASRPSPEIRQRLATALHQADELAALQELLGAAWPLGLSANETLLLLEADRHRGQPARARELVQRLRMQPAGHHADTAELGAAASEALLWGLVAMICLDANLPDAGLDAIDVAVALEPDNVTYRNNRVVILLRLDRQQEAAKEWERVLQLDPTRAEQPR